MSDGLYFEDLSVGQKASFGKTVTATVEVMALHPDKHRATLRTVCTVGGKPVLEGEAFVSVPSRAARAQAAE